MNHRMSELLDQVSTDVSGKWVSTDDLEKFAELIVRECAGRVDNILREKKDGGGTMGDDIREHFGVEL
jgi:hypothetical protein